MACTSIRLQIFGTRMLYCLRDIQVFYFHFYHVRLNTRSYYNQEETNYVVDGFTLGFAVSCLYFKTTLNCRNLPSALSMLEIASDKVAKDLLAGRMVGPFLTPPFSNLHVSPLKDPSKFRIVHHLSHPKCISANDFIPTEFSIPLQDAILGIKQFKFP